MLSLSVAQIRKLEEFTRDVSEELAPVFVVRELAANGGKLIRSTGAVECTLTAGGNVYSESVVTPEPGAGSIFACKRGN